jgi:hypothetical protein
MVTSSEVRELETCGRHRAARIFFTACRMIGAGPTGEPITLLRFHEVKQWLPV